MCKKGKQTGCQREPSDDLDNRRSIQVGHDDLVHHLRYPPESLLSGDGKKNPSYCRAVEKSEAGSRLQGGRNVLGRYNARQHSPCRDKTLQGHYHVTPATTMPLGGEGSTKSWAI